MLLRSWLIFWKEFKQISRDPRMISVVIGLPMITLILYGYAFNLDVKHIPLAVYDQDHSQTSRDLINAFIRNEYFDMVLAPNSYSALTEAIDGGKAMVGLVIPARFAADLAARRNVQVLIAIDGSDSTRATTGLSYASTIVQQYSTSITMTALQRIGGATASSAPLDNRARFWYNPELKSTYFLVPGLIAMILSSLSSLLTSVTVARERERGTIELLVVSPVMPVELILRQIVSIRAHRTGRRDTGDDCQRHPLPRTAARQPTAGHPVRAVLPAAGAGIGAIHLESPLRHNSSRKPSPR